ncbi:hypothetical protein [Methylobacterium sp. SyP6R]|uniref:hypothetical protein n=1 Tax=Methylobacterium sp. SyP6R TaxID=2718876 RepID=UPI001F2B7256|nr:hypothetical protein [Methylobacterium sp. SyP6R]MCF4128254.1 hypothetical protein [Methylobacterium sp. SyP6R]
MGEPNCALVDTPMPSSSVSTSSVAAIDDVRSGSRIASRAAALRILVRGGSEIVKPGVNVPGAAKPASSGLAAPMSEFQEAERVVPTTDDEMLNDMFVARVDDIQKQIRDKHRLCRMPNR